MVPKNTPVGKGMIIAKATLYRLIHMNTGIKRNRDTRTTTIYRDTVPRLQWLAIKMMVCFHYKTIIFA